MHRDINSEIPYIKLDLNTEEDLAGLNSLFGLNKNWALTTLYKAE